MNILRLVFLTSALGATPVAVKLGFISLSGLITLVICLIALLSFVFRAKFMRADVKITVPLILFCFWSLIWFVWSYEPAKQINNNLVVWFGLLFILLRASCLNIRKKKNLVKLDKMIDSSTMIYFVIQLFELFSRAKSSETTQVGLVFFSFHLVKLFNGERRSLFFLTGILFMQILLGARIVVFAEMFILAFGRLFLKGINLSRLRKYKWSSLVVVGILVGAIVFSIYSGAIEKTFGGGDRALMVGGVTINTSGRLSMWKIILDSALDSPWVGHGTPGPVQMLGTERWKHPHNDYLRLFHQLGLAGLSLWLFFIGQSLITSWRGARKLPNFQARSWCSSTFLTIIGISIIMVTDNSIVYSYVVYPVSAMIGITLALQRGQSRKLDLSLQRSDVSKVISSPI